MIGIKAAGGIIGPFPHEDAAWEFAGRFGIEDPQIVTLFAPLAGYLVEQAFNSWRRTSGATPDEHRVAALKMFQGFVDRTIPAGLSPDEMEAALTMAQQLRELITPDRSKMSIEELAELIYVEQGRKLFPAVAALRMERGLGLREAHTPMLRIHQRHQ
jgi:hypothetical protein